MTKRLVYFFAVLLLFFCLSAPLAFGQSVEDIQKKINELQEKLANAQSQEKTLSSEIAKINNQISLTQLKIESAQEKILVLGGKIDKLSASINSLEASLEHASIVLAHRIVKTYIVSRDDNLVFLLSSSDFADLLQRFEYLRLAQKSDKKQMYNMATIKKNYSDRKNELESIKMEQQLLYEQLKKLQADLTRQEKQKQSLLKVTKNDEKTYQALINQAKQELIAIQTSQFTGKRDVKKGETIGLMGSTGFSTGPHLHFGVYNLSEDQANNFNYGSGDSDPLAYLSNRTVQVENGACLDKSGVTGIGSGNHDWPMSSPRISQCYGKTPYSFVYANGLHAGLDMYDNGDIIVRADNDGVAYFYRGSSSFGNNVRVFHADGKMTLFLHLQ